MFCFVLFSEFTVVIWFFQLERQVNHRFSNWGNACKRKPDKRLRLFVEDMYKSEMVNTLKAQLEHFNITCFIVYKSKSFGFEWCLGTFMVEEAETKIPYFTTPCCVFPSKVKSLNEFYKSNKLSAFTQEHILVGAQCFGNHPKSSDETFYIFVAIRLCRGQPRHSALVRVSFQAAIGDDSVWPPIRGQRSQSKGLINT